MKNNSLSQGMATSLAVYFTLFQKSTHMKLRSYYLLTMPLMVLGLLFNTPGADAQVATSTYAFFNHHTLSAPLDPVRVRNSAGTVCDNSTPLMYNHYIVTGGQPSPGFVAWNDSTNLVNTAINTPVQNRFKATAGRPTTLTMDIYVGRWPDMPNTPTTKNNEIINDVEVRIGTLGGDYHYDETKITSRTLIEETAYHRLYRCEVAVNFKRGATTGYVVLTVPIHSYTVYDQHTRYEEFVIPFLVEGVMDPSLPILGTTQEPSIPYLVLHRPPGDLSESSITTTTRTCRGLEETVADEQANSVNASVKLGVKGSAGIFVTVDYEIYAKFTGSASAGSMEMSANSTETCLEVTNTFSTQDLANGAIGSDIFVGYSRTLEYGVFPNVALDGCSYRIDTSLIFIPLEAKPFSFTKSGILADILRLEGIVADSNAVGVKKSAEAKYQIDLWNEVLALNEANINNPDNVPLPNVEEGGFSGGTSKTYSTTLGTTNTRTLNVQHFLEGNVGLEAVVNVAGSGFSAGYNFKTKKTFGQTASGSQSSSTTISYTLADDDDGDLFVMDQVVADPMYGTPVFRLDSGSRTSCPYEAGYQRDQPSLKHSATTDEHILSQGNPVGGSTTFLVNLCNESNETRRYNLKLNPESNLKGAVVSAAGVPLNGNDLGQSFNIPGGACLEDVVVTVGMLNASSPQSYPGLELYLYADCEEDIQSSVFASVFFGEATSTEEAPRKISQVAVFPNPASQTATLAFELLESAPVRVEVYDALGKLHAPGLNERLPAGTQQRTVDVSQLPSGVYWLRIQSGPSDFLTRKLVVNH